MTTEQLDELERLERAASGRTWTVRETGLTEQKGHALTGGAVYADHVRLGSSPDSFKGEIIGGRVGMIDRIKNADLALLLAARNALRALIAEVRRLRAMVGEDAPAVAPEDAGEGKPDQGGGDRCAPRHDETVVRGPGVGR